jgi:3',5'-cyclic AMP phosphodiesterase CpdA
MVNRGMNGQEWGWFFEAGEKYFKNLPFAPMVGNHETGGVVTSAPQQENLAYLSYFNNPSNHTGTFAEGSSYSFNFGTVHLLCLDNEDLFDAMEVQSKTGEKKYLESALDWIKKDLTTATLQNKWKVVTMHQPIYGANRDEDDLRKVLAPVFDKGKVDLVITGHDHYYFRSFPMKYDSLKNDGEIVPIDQFGTVYLIGGSTCAKMYPQKFAKPYQAVVMASGEFPGRYPTLRNDPLTLQNYSTFTASQAKLHYRFFDKNGNLKDEVVLQKLGKK